MLRDVVVHLANDQPLLADLFAIPQPSDSSLVCTNLRTLSGKTPSFVAEGGSTFLFPLHHVRFVEVPQRAIERAEAEAAESRSDRTPTEAAEGPGPAAGGRRARTGRRAIDGPDAPVRLPAPAVTSGARTAEGAAPAALDQAPEVTAGLRELASVATAFAELAQLPPADATTPIVPAGWDGTDDDEDDEDESGEDEDDPAPAGGSRERPDGADDDAYTAELLRKIRDA